MVACVHQQDGLALIDVALLQGGDGGIGQLGGLVINVGVYVVGVQDGDGGVLARQPARQKPAGRQRPWPRQRR